MDQTITHARARIPLMVLAGCCMAISMAFAVHAADNIPVPSGLFPTGVTQDSSPDRIAETFPGIPYRVDGAVNEQGEYTLFSEPSRRFASPGLNCSGLVLAMCRFLLQRNFSLAEVMRDRLGDSGPDSPHGEDWDFGWDVILNISEGYRRRLLLPGGVEADPALGTGFAPRGYDIHAPATWKELPDRLRPGHIYLVSLNVEGRRKGYGLQHYHVGLVHVDERGGAWFYQTTGTGKKANRRDLKHPQGQASFQRAFANNGPYRKMMLILELALPQSKVQ